MRHLPVFVLLLACLTVGLLGAAPPAAADEAPHIVKAKDDQDRRLKSAMRREANAPGTIKRFLAGEIQRSDRNPSPMTLFLAGRALFQTALDLPEAEKRRQLMRAFGYLKRAWHLDGKDRKFEFWGAGLGLALIYNELKKPDQADTILRRVRQQAPREIRPLQTHVQILLSNGRFAEAAAALEALYALNPKDEQVAAGLAQTWYRAGDFERAYVALQRIRALPLWGREPAWQLMYLDATLRTNRLDETIALLEGMRSSATWHEDPTLQQQLARLYFDHKKDPPRALAELKAYLPRAPGDHAARSLLIDLAVQAGEFPLAKRELKVLVPTLKDPKHREHAEHLLRALEQGRDPRRSMGRQVPTKPMGPQAPVAVPEEGPYVKLLRRCIDPDVTVRRKALQEYYELDLPVAHPIIPARLQHGQEEDPACRIYIVRILGMFNTRETEDVSVPRDIAVVLAWTLENDPEPEVRQVAAEELGKLGPRASLIYLLAHFAGLHFALPDDAEMRKKLETEFNAVRTALVALTGRRDVPVTERSWVQVEDAESNRGAWLAWFEKEAGAATLIEAFDELDSLTPQSTAPLSVPSFLLKYVFTYCFSGRHRSVQQRAYRLLRNHVPRDKQGRLPPKGLWKNFPLLDDKVLAETEAKALDAQLLAWWQEATRPPPTPDAQRDPQSDAQPDGR